MAEQGTESFWTCGQERMIFFSYDRVKGCCANLKTGLSPHLGDYGPGGALDIDELVNAKREHLAAVRRRETPAACVDCPSWQRVEWPDSPYLFNDVNLGQLTACNTDCYYCRTNSNSSPVAVSARTAPRLLPLLKQMVERGYIDPNAIIRFGGGEPSIAPEFEDTVNYFVDAGRRFFMNSSGVKYSSAIERMLRSGREGNRLVISADCATPETYKIIKRFDVGKRMWDNIARYAQVGPDFLEVKYIVLPENWHETGDFVRKCHEIGVRRVSFDLDSNPFLAGIADSLTDEMIESIAILIHEAKQRAMSVYQSGSGDAVWRYENGHARVEAALRRISGGRLTLDISETGFIVLTRAAQNLDGGTPIGWGRCDNVTAAPLNSEPGAIYLQEDGNASVHRIEQTQISVSAGEACTVEVIARPAGRSRLMIEFRDREQGRYTRAKYDLERKHVTDALDDEAAIGAFNAEWVRCQLTLRPTSSSAVFNVTLIDDTGSHIYRGTGQAGVHIRRPILYRRSVAQAA
jgi:molybdenum cofactor biosynthesis enzyme MoaA